MFWNPQLMNLPFFILFVDVFSLSFCHYFLSPCLVLMKTSYLSPPMLKLFETVVVPATRVWVCVWDMHRTLQFLIGHFIFCFFFFFLFFFSPPFPFPFFSLLLFLNLVPPPRRWRKVTMQDFPFFLSLFFLLLFSLSVSMVWCFVCIK